MVNRGELTEAVNGWITTRHGAEFYARQAIAALPQFNPKSVRTHLQKLARLGRLTAIPDKGGNCYQSVRRNGFAGRCGRMVMSRRLISAINSW